MLLIPKEVNFQGVYLPPVLVALAIAIAATLFTSRLLNHYRLTRFVALPRMVFLSMIAIYLVLIDLFIIRI